jgi:hypothetical protein
MATNPQDRELRKEGKEKALPLTTQPPLDANRKKATTAPVE